MIEAGRAWARGELAMSEARTAAFAAHTAARDANQAAACAAGSQNRSFEKIMLISQDILSIILLTKGEGRYGKRKKGVFIDR